MSLKLLYDRNQFFHGIKTMDEARNIWRAEIQSGKPVACIWFLLETQDELQSCLYGNCYRSNQSEEPRLIFTELEDYPTYMNPSASFVKRRGPNKLAELSRATIFDNLNCSCRTKGDNCKGILSEKIDQLQIPETEKFMIKKLIPLANRNNFKYFLESFYPLP